MKLPLFFHTKDVEKETISGEDKEVAVASVWGDSLFKCLKHLTGKYKTKKPKANEKNMVGK